MNSTWLPFFNENCCEELYAITHQRNSKLSWQIKLQAPEEPENDHLMVSEASFGQLEFYAATAEPSVLLGTQNTGWVISLISLANGAMGILSTPLKDICEGATQLERGK